MKKIILPFCALLAITESVVAEVDVTQIIITGSRSGINAETKASTHVLTQRDIEKSTANNLPELLSQIPGVSIEQSGSLGSLSSVRMRGTEADQVLILVDGVRTSSASNGSTALQFIPIGQVQRVEVLKGTRSGLYGSEAIGGVIQIFTKTGKNSQGGYADIGYGSDNTKSVSTGFNNVTDLFYYGLNVGYLDTNGFNSTVNNSGENADADGFDQRDFSFNIGHTSKNGTQFDFKYLTSSGNTEFDTGTQDENNNTDFDNEFANLDIKTPLLSNLDLTVNLGYLTDEQETFGTNISEFNTQRESASTFLSYKVTSKQSFILGYEHFNDELETTSSFIEDERFNSAVFGEYAVNSSLADFHLTYRTDDNEAFDRENTGSASVTVPINKNHSVSLSYGTGFKAPSFNEMFFPFTDYGFGFTFEGNPDLDPERSSSTEISYTGNFNNIMLTGAAYRTEIEDLIVSTADFSGVNNIDNADIRGAEISIEGKFMHFSTGLGLSYVDARNKETDDRLLRRPRSSARFYIDKNINNLDLSLVIFSESNRQQSATTQTAGYAIVDLSTLYKFSKKSSVKFQIKNLFDKEYLLVDTSLGKFRTPDRAAEITYKYKF
jgi:vitamin B12 transporter